MCLLLYNNILQYNYYNDYWEELAQGALSSTFNMYIVFGHCSILFLTIVLYCFIAIYIC